MIEFDEIIGYHGTGSEVADIILKTKFRIPNETPDEWLGNGVYFFVDGMGCPMKNAKNWAKTSAYKGKKEYRYDFCSVLRSHIKVEGTRVVDLRTKEDSDTFNSIRKELMDVHGQKFANYVRKKLGGKRNSKILKIDAIICNTIRVFQEVDVIIADRYMQITKLERICMNSYNAKGEKTTLVQLQPNCTVCAVFDVNVIKETVFHEKKINVE